MTNPALTGTGRLQYEYTHTRAAPKSCLSVQNEDNARTTPIRAASCAPWLSAPTRKIVRVAPTLVQTPTIEFGDRSMVASGAVWRRCGVNLESAWDVWSISGHFAIDFGSASGQCWSTRGPRAVTLGSNFGATRATLGAALPIQGPLDSRASWGRSSATLWSIWGRAVVTRPPRALGYAEYV